MRYFLAFLGGGIATGLIATMLGNRSGIIAALRRIAGLPSAGGDDGSIKARLDRARREAKELRDAIDGSRGEIQGARDDASQLADILQSIQDANDDSTNRDKRGGDSGNGAVNP